MPDARLKDVWVCERPKCQAAYVGVDPPKACNCTRLFKVECGWEYFSNMYDDKAEAEAEGKDC